MPARQALSNSTSFLALYFSPLLGTKGLALTLEVNYLSGQPWEETALLFPIPGWEGPKVLFRVYPSPGTAWDKDLRNWLKPSLSLLEESINIHGLFTP